MHDIKNILFVTMLYFGFVGLGYTQSIHEITPVEAIHLVEDIIRQEIPENRLITSAITPSTYKNNAAYTIRGQIGQDGYEAIVDAQAARVMQIKRNGESFYTWQGILVVGHRGSVKFAPENTIPAFQSAIDYGADLIEIDIRETGDGELVIIHDETVDRTTDGTGKVSELTLKEIKKLDAGSWFGSKFKDTRVPTLREALAAIRGKALPDLDFKAGTPKKLVALIREEGLLGKVTLYCGDWALMRETLKISDEFIIRPTVPSGTVGLPVILKELNPPVVNVNWREFSERLIREVHLAGRKSFMNIMQHDTESAMQLVIDTFPDYLQSDHIDILMPLLRSRGLHK